MTAFLFGVLIGGLIIRILDLYIDWYVKRGK